MTVLMSLAVLADDPPAPVQPDRSPPPRRAPPLGARVRCGWVRCGWVRLGWVRCVWVRLGTATGWPVAVILVLQAAASVRLASGLGGPVAARLLSLLLMLGATLALHGVTRRLIDRRSAFFAAALFAGLGGTAVLGSLASGGAISLSLVALAAWLGIRAAEAAEGSGRAQGALAVASGGALALATATDHRCGPAALIVVLVAALASWRSRGPAAAWRGAALMCAVPGLLLAAGWLAASRLGAGQPYFAHVLTALPSKAASSPAGLLAAAGPWLGVVAILAAIGALAQLAARPAWPVTAMSVILAVAVAAVPLAVAANLSAAGLLWPGTCGAWFACIVAGYAVTSLARGVPRHKSAAAFGVGLGLVALAAGPGLSWPAQQLGGRPAGPIVATMATVLARHGGPVLSNDGGLLQDYLGPEVADRVIVGPARCRLPDPAAGSRRTALAACQEAIRRHYFGVILLSLGPAARADRLERTIVLAGYRRLAAQPGGLAGSSWNVWVRAGRP
jgi:MFS family permease